jgi:hypothetical protein
MRAVSLFFAVATLAVVVAAPAHTQTRPPVTSPEASTSPECRYFLPQVPTRPPTPPGADGDVPGGGAPQEPFFGSVLVVAPPAGVGAVPRNVELVLGGALNEVEDGFWDISLRGPAGAIPFTRDGARLLPDGGLLPVGSVTLALAANATHPCQGCFPPGEQRIDVIDVVDVTPPAFSELIVHEFVPPPLEQQTRCSNILGTGDLFEAAVVTDESATVHVAARHALVAPRVVMPGMLALRGELAVLVVNLATTPLVSAGDDVVAVFVARDLAGNVSSPLATRVRARSLLTITDPATTLDEVPELRCALDAAPETHVPSHLPRNPSLRVVFPFEEIPLALAREGEVVALVPGADVFDDARAGRLYSPARPMDPGAWDLVSLPCERCICPACTSPLHVPLVLDDVVDVDPPSRPVVRALIDDPAPPRSNGTCTPDRAATLAILAPGEDDTAGPFDLVYDVVVQLGDDPPRPVGVALPALTRADGDVVVRLPTASLGRIIGEPFTLVVAARDTAGNVARTTYAQVGIGDDAGCAAAPAGVPAQLVFAWLWVRRRRRR